MNPSSVLLTDRVAVVTGGGAGIGRGIARGLAAFGAKVAVWERDPDTAASAADEVGGLGITTDVRQSAEVDAALARTAGRARTGQHPGQQRRRRVLLAPARDLGERLGRPLPGQPQARHPVHPAGGPHHGGCRTGGQHHQRDLDRGGAGRTGYAAYAAAKAGVINFTKTAALELAPHGIRVNALAPDITLTEGMAGGGPARGRGALRPHRPDGPARPRRRDGRCGGVPGRGLSSYVTGQTIHVDGGTQASSGWYHHPDTGAYVLGPA